MKDVTENNVVEVEEVDGVEVITLEPEESNGSVGGTVVKVLLGLGAAAGAGWLIKNRKKLKERREAKKIADLEKAGYVVSLPYEQLANEVVDDTKSDNQ